MSKKIIYLLSLLMALSLVFASCKKNGAGDISGTAPDNGFDNSPDTENGLAGDSTWLDENSSDLIKNEPIPNFQTTGGVAYFRNPIVVVMGTTGSDVVVFAEKRYKSPGSANDIGVNGETATDIVYISSQNSGKKWGTPQIVGRTAQSQNGTDAVASPVVFKVAEDKVIVVASAGSGLSRTSQSYNDRNPKSELKYTIGTYKNGTFTWEGNAWKDMTTEAEAAVKTVTEGYKQFGVLSAKGVVTGTLGSNVELYLAVTVAEQGTEGSGIKEFMGNVIMKGTYSGSGNVTWSTVNSTAVAFSEKNDTYSSHKASLVIASSGASADQIEYLAVGSPGYGNDKIGYAKASGQPQDNGILGSEGSPSYLVVSNWQGQNSYDPNGYKNENGIKQRLYAHVKSLNNTITVYALNDTGFAQKGNTYAIKAYPEDNTALAKSSSMDVLGDGTIIMVAEQGGSEKEYYLVYKRFTQKFLATKLGL